jgi:hypothetical protein
MSDQSWKVGYNGFRYPEGYSVTPIQNAALRNGTLIRPTVCSVCRDGRSEKPQGRDYRFLHLEDYSRPLVIHPACKACHAALHARFRDPERWQRLLARHARPGDWATLLSLDPASQIRPFAETYPNGLPPPTTIARLEDQPSLFEFSGHHD